MADKFYNLGLKGTTFRVVLAEDEETQMKGLSGLNKLGKKKGMLFVFHDPILTEMVMEGMNFGLDFIFLDKNFNVLQLDTLPNSPEAFTYTKQPTDMILELNAGIIQTLGLQVGDILEPSEELLTQFEGIQKFKHGGKFERVGDKVYEYKEDDIKAEEGRLQILNDGGEVVANIDSGARIFSRKHTKELVEKFKKGDKKALGLKIAEIIEIQNNQTQEYVNH